MNFLIDEGNIFIFIQMVYLILVFHLFALITINLLNDHKSCHWLILIVITCTHKNKCTTLNFNQQFRENI